MIKFMSIGFLLALSFQGNSCDTLPKDSILSVLNPAIPVPQIPGVLSSKWSEHVKDFLALIDVNKVTSVVIVHLSDPEVLNFLGFILSDEFKQTVWEFENIAEFKEAYTFLAEKGYDVEAAIDFINKQLELPSFEPTHFTKTARGMTALIEDLIAVLPIEEMKSLFESKLETSPEVKELFDTINSPEFLDIMRRMSVNPKFEEFKETFESYGFDFKYLCQMAKEIFGEYFQGVFCENL